MYLVTLPGPAAADPAAFARRAARAGAAMLEVRGDLTPALAPFDSTLPLVLAPRGRDLDALAACPDMRVAWLDLEEAEFGARRPPPGARLLVSSHDRDGMPSERALRDRAARMRVAGAELVKIAVTPRRPADLLVLEELRRDLAVAGPVIVTAMGPLARLDRILGARRNAWTYAALEPGAESAPGQLTIAEHRRLEGDSPPLLLGVLGGPGLRSLSPLIHEGLLADHGLRGAYLAFPTDDGDESFRALAALGLGGFSVTSPWKRRIAARMDELDPLAARLGSVNTAVLLGRRWRGYQTDVVGLTEGYPEFRGRRRAVVLGAGGVVSAVLEALARLEVEAVAVHARDGRALAGLAADFPIAVGPLEEAHREAADILIWTIPVDRDDVVLPAPRPGALALDLRYGGETAFMRRARDLGYAVADGLRMLAAQALAQFELFTGLTCGEADLERTLERLKAARD